MKVKLLSRVRLLATPWTAAYQAPPSMGFSRQEYWSGVPLPSQLLLPTHCYIWTIINLRTRREAGSITPCCLVGRRVTIKVWSQPSRLSFCWLSFHIVLLAVHLKFLFILVLAMLGLHRCWGFSLVAARVGWFLVVLRGLLISAAFLLRSTGFGHPGFSSVAHGLSSCGTWA